MRTLSTTSEISGGGALACRVRELCASLASVPSRVSSGSCIETTAGPALESSTWVMFMAPAGTPREIVTRLSQEAHKAVFESDIKTRFSEIGIEPAGGTPEQTSKFLAEEITKWSKVITTAGVKAEQ